MTIDEAIAHAEEVAWSCEEQAKQCDSDDRYERHVMHGNAKCAAEHRQLAEWLTELKELREQKAEYKRLLKMAVEDISKMPCNNDTHIPDSCYICVKHGNCTYADSFKWCKADIALKLIGETND